MTLSDVVAAAVAPGDRVWLQYANELVRSGVFLGVAALPWERERVGVCFTTTPSGDVVEWIDPAALKDMQCTIPRELQERVESRRQKDRG